MPDKEKAYAGIHYQSYLDLDKLLDAQNLRSIEVSDEAAHDEMLFIIIHQVYELWFKQIIHELNSAMEMFASPELDEKNLSFLVHRLDRICEIQELLIQQIRVLETMTPLDFLEFRKYLFPASGFQSFQFREVEVMMGLRTDQRLKYNNKPYYSVFTEEQTKRLKAIEMEGSLFDKVEDWLERFPFTNLQAFNFIEQYKVSVERMLKEESDAIKATKYLDAHEKEMRLAMLGSSGEYYQIILNPAEHEKLRKEGKVRLSYRATLAALFIALYRDEPILQMPFNLLQNIINIDENFTAWRYRHAQMVQRMLGKKIGTGGSSGHDYLKATASQHHIFNDFLNISTFMVPRAYRPVLPDYVEKELGFYYSVTKNEK